MPIWKTNIHKSEEEKRETCPECGQELGSDGRCYNEKCIAWDPVSQYDPREIEVNAYVDSIAEKHNVTRKEIAHQLELGRDVELEHTNDPHEAESIALDHLDEIPDYYTRLAKMEKDVKPMVEEVPTNASKAIDEVKTEMKRLDHSYYSEFGDIEETEDEIKFEVRHWGKWIVSNDDRNDPDNEGEDFDDWDWESLDEAWVKKLDKIVTDVNKKYNVRVTWNTGEKNWIYIEVKKQALTESQAQEIHHEYDRLSKELGIDLNDLVYGPKGFMATVYPNGFPDFNGDVIYSEDHWNEMKKWAKETRGIDLKVAEQVKTSELDEAYTSLDMDKINFHDLVGKKQIDYDAMPVVNQADEENEIYFIYDVEITKDQVLDFICKRYNLAADILTVEDAQPFVDQVANNPEEFMQHMSEELFEDAQEAAQAFVDKEAVEDYGPKKFEVEADDSDDVQPEMDEAYTKQEIDGVSVDMDDYDIDFGADMVFALMSIWRPFYGDPTVVLRFQYDGYIENAHYKWEPDGLDTYVPYGETKVLYKSGKGGLESVTIDEMKPDYEVYRLETLDTLEREDVLDILNVTDEQLKKIEEAARKIASDQLRKRIAEMIMDDPDMWPDRD